MACRKCRFETSETLCKICGYIEQVELPESRAACAACKAPIASPANETGLCHVCSALLEVVKKSGWFVRANFEWGQENIRLANLKRELLQ